MILASLYSGGKDSAFSLYLAEQMGHEVPCVVNIMPEDEASWIFHTPNLGVVPLMAESMGKRLITAPSTGSEEGDMTGLREALEGLDVDGVVTGAVWSDYQWDRMNLVCGDLGLKVVSPLWRKDQDMVMDELLASGIRAIIVGCYAEGLGEEWLGREIDRSAAEELRMIRAKTGISILGEGGEYESMTVDSPLYRLPLSIDSSRREWSRSGGTLRVESASLVPRTGPSDGTSGASACWRRPRSRTWTSRPPRTSACG
jgi:ABC transporter with metal-binding/Fe-S-binding domain ATP-binding protein